MTPTHKALFRDLSEIDSLLKVPHDPSADLLLKERVERFARVTGRTAIEVVIAWRRQHSPTLDPRPPKAPTIVRESAPARARFEV